MKIHLISKRDIISLLLGIITTVAVAWGCEILREHEAFSNVQEDGGNYLTPEARKKMVIWERTAGTLVIYSESIAPNLGKPVLDGSAKTAAEKFATWFEIPAEVRSIYYQSDKICFDVAVGWPFIALSANCVPSKTGPFDNGIRVTVFDQLYLFPLKPYWPGLMFDSIIFAPIWFGITLLISKAQRFRCKRKNQCPVCGYSLQQLTRPGCPECGWHRLPTESENKVKPTTK